MSKNLQNKTSLFIEKAILKHGNTFDYSRVEYLNSKTKVCIVSKYIQNYLLSRQKRITEFNKSL